MKLLCWVDFLLTINGGFTGFHMFWRNPHWSYCETLPSRLISIYPTTSQTLCFMIFFTKLFFLLMLLYWDSKLVAKVNEEMEKYTDLKIELQRMWSICIAIVPLIIRCLGSNLNICCRTLVPKLQKSVLLNFKVVCDWTYLKLWHSLKLFAFSCVFNFTHDVLSNNNNNAKDCYIIVHCLLI